MAKKARKKAKKASKKKASRKKEGKKKAVRKTSKRSTKKAGGRKKAKKKARRTTLYSSKGKKLYAVRKADGTFKDIQSYQRAHSMDIARTSAAEEAQTSG